MLSFVAAYLYKRNCPFYLFIIYFIYEHLHWKLELKEVMEDYGTVLSVKIIKDRETGRSKGFAFCELEEEEGAKKAITELNGSEYAGRPMVVKEALPKN